MFVVLLWPIEVVGIRNQTFYSERGRRVTRRAPRSGAGSRACALDRDRQVTGGSPGRLREDKMWVEADSTTAADRPGNDRPVPSVLFLEPSDHPRRRRGVMSLCPDDHSLVEACRAGQTEAFGALVERYQDRLYQTIRRLNGSSEDSKDILQDAFLRAFQKLDQFQGDSSFYTWVYRIAINLALSGYRRQKTRAWLGRKSGRTAPHNQEPADPSADADPTLSIERAERDRSVQAALSQLGQEHRAVIVLKDFDGRHYEEISAILQVPVGTVRSRLHRARCELRDRLRSLVDEEQPVRQATPAAT